MSECPGCTELVDEKGKNILHVAVENKTTDGIATGRKVNKKKRALADSKFMESFLTVATLIATASFAAAFTVPGGFNGDEGSKQGMPILLRKLAFKAFMISNTVAFACSVTGLLLRVTMYLRKEYDFDDIYDPAASESSILYTFIVIALHSIQVAFATGIYVVLTPYLGLAIFLCTLPIALPLLGLNTVFNLYLTELRKNE
ncbi:ankyrin repeat-containing protein [Artemisia annua]|uniref:Ankyrin repeat-containing protein n=1 Tax=Artemisia annua TaxID=35608 RepID=A0A2U1PB69_ARTAN|nr:ankyrin repeat-containing protein [Artemisia annua]